MPDINSYLDSITSSIKQLRQDFNDFQLEERPSIRSGLWANRPTNASLRVSDRYFATDSTRNIEYVWDGTRWLGPRTTTVIPFFPNITTNAFTANTSNVFFDAHPDGASDLYVEAIQSAAFVNALNSGNNSTSYWAYTYRFRNSAATTSLTGSVNTSTFTVATLTPIVLLSNTVVTRTNFYDLFIDVAKGGSTGTPGTLFVDPLKITYRLLGT